MKTSKHNNFRLLLQKLRMEIGTALDILKEKHGLGGLKLTTCKFDPVGGTFVFKLEGMREGGTLTIESNYALLGLSRLATRGQPMWVLPPLGSYFSHANGRRYRVLGATTGDTIICARDDDKQFLFNPDDVIKLVDGELAPEAKIMPAYTTDPRQKV
jgi:hypothetical protein